MRDAAHSTGRNRQSLAHYGSQTGYYATSGDSRPPPVPQPKGLRRDAVSCKSRHHSLHAQHVDGPHQVITQHPRLYSLLAELSPQLSLIHI